MPKKIDKCVSAYVNTIAHINFPDGQIKCAICPLMGESPRKWCRLTGEYIVSDQCQGAWCPLEIQGFTGSFADMEEEEDEVKF